MSENTAMPSPRRIRRDFSAVLMPVGVLAGCTLYYVLVRWLGVQVEVWKGINTFTDPAWFGSAVLAPALSGLVTGLIVGHHGKWYAMLPLLLIHSADYYHLRGMAGVEDVLGTGFFIFIMLVMLELALVAGWVGEVLRMRGSGRDVRA